MKYYIREGRRFVEIQSMVGMYYNKDGMLTSVKTEDSIGVCVIDDFEKAVIASIHKTQYRMDWDEANKFCKTVFGGGWHLPSVEELLIAVKINTFDWNHSTLWTSTQSAINTAFYWTSSLYLDYMGYSYVVVPFLTIHK